jgi:Fe-S-cluster containining protein
MKELLELRLRTNCGYCTNKCCSQPHDWVYLTSRESSRLSTTSGIPEKEFTVKRQFANDDYVFRTLNLPCRFLDAQTGHCTVYESRPLACRLFPFYVDPLTGDATLYSSECGDNLLFPHPDSKEGWRLIEVEEDVRRWMVELWAEAVVKE